MQIDRTKNSVTVTANSDIERKVLDHIVDLVRVVESHTIFTMLADEVATHSHKEACYA